MKIRDVIKLLEEDGWYLMQTRGSHRQYKHPVKPGRVTLAGHPGDDLAKGTLGSVLKQAGLTRNEVMKYLVIVERTESNYSAFSPDIPGCVATGKSRGEAITAMKEAIEMHLEGLREDHLEIPKPGTSAEYVEVA